MEEKRKLWIEFRNSLTNRGLTKDLVDFIYKDLTEAVGRDISQEFEQALNTVLRFAPNLFIERYDNIFNIHILVDAKGKEIRCI